MKKFCSILLAAIAATAATVSTSAAKAFVLPHVLEKSGTINNTQYTFDTQFFFTYTAGLPGVPKRQARGSSHVDLYLYNDDGTPMQSATQKDVANPASYDLSPTKRKASVRLDDLILAAGGFDGPDVLKSGFAIIIVRGDEKFVNVTGFVVNSHTSAFDLSVFGFDPQPIQAAP